MRVLNTRAEDKIPSDTQKEYTSSNTQATPTGSSNVPV